MLSQELNVLDHGLERVVPGILESFRAPRASFIDKHQLISPGERPKVGKKIGVVRTRPAVQQ
jgi:hypothetical protein